MSKKGARAHPGSGSGKISFDGSTEDAVVEVKDAAMSYAMNARYLRRLLDTATRQSKDAILVVQFPGITVTARLDYRDDNG